MAPAKKQMKLLRISLYFFLQGRGRGGEAAVLVDDSAGSRPLLPLLFLLGRAALLGSILRLPFLNPNPRNALDLRGDGKSLRRVPQPGEGAG